MNRLSINLINNFDLGVHCYASNIYNASKKLYLRKFTNKFFKSFNNIIYLNTINFKFDFINNLNFVDSLKFLFPSIYNNCISRYTYIKAQFYFIVSSLSNPKFFIQILKILFIYNYKRSYNLLFNCFLNYNVLQLYSKIDYRRYIYKFNNKYHSYKGKNKYKKYFVKLVNRKFSKYRWFKSLYYISFGWRNKVRVSSPLINISNKLFMNHLIFRKSKVGLFGQNLLKNKIIYVRFYLPIILKMVLFYNLKNFIPKIIKIFNILDSYLKSLYILIYNISNNIIFNPKILNISYNLNSFLYYSKQFLYFENRLIFNNVSQLWKYIHNYKFINSINIYKDLKISVLKKRFYIISSCLDFLKSFVLRDRNLKIMFYKNILFLLLLLYPCFSRKNTKFFLLNIYMIFKAHKFLFYTNSKKKLIYNLKRLFRNDKYFTNYNRRRYFWKFLTKAYLFKDNIDLIKNALIVKLFNKMIYFRKLVK